MLRNSATLITIAAQPERSTRKLGRDRKIIIDRRLISIPLLAFVTHKLDSETFHQWRNCRADTKRNALQCIHRAGVFKIILKRRLDRHLGLRAPISDKGAA